MTVAIQGASSVHVDVGAAELEEGGGILEHLLERIGLPVVRVVCELNGSLDIYSRVSSGNMTRIPQHTKIDIVEEGKVQRCSNREVLVFGENHVAAVIALLDSVEDVLGIIFAMSARFNAACLCTRR